MAYQEDIALMAHLMRRAGFGAGRDELEARAAKGYEATVEELLHPETQPPRRLYAAAVSAGIHCCRAASRRWAMSTGCTIWSIPSGRSKKRWRCSGTMCSPPAIRRWTTTTSCWSRSAVPRTRDGQLSRPAADGRKKPDDDFLARQPAEPRQGGQRELGPRTARAVQPRRRQLYRKGCSRMLAGVHRLDLRDQYPRAPYGRFPWKFEYRPRRSRRRREGVPRAQGPVQRRRHHRHRGTAAGLRQVHLPAPV